MTRILHALGACLLVPALAAAQTPGLSGGVPTGPATADSLSLTLADAIERGLKQNLGVILEEQQVRASGSARLQALSDLLPHLSGYVRESRQIVDLAAYGFTGFPGLEIPNRVGPFDVFDARLALSAPIVDLSAWQHLQAAGASQTAAKSDSKTVRETVVLAVGNLYLLAIADQARVDSAAAQVATADALVRLANDRHAAGLVPQIDVVRQQVQLQSARAQQIAATTTLATRKLQLARAIGLPAGQAFTLATRTAFVAGAVPSLEDALREAAARRPDLMSARARVDAARASKRAALSGHLPSLRLDADVGKLGNSADSSLATYTVAAAVHVPIFSGGQTQAEVQRADTELRQREAELSDLENGLRYDVESALLTLQSAASAVDVASSASDLAKEELAQAQDRYTAGVANTVELVEAQEAVARASEQYITSVYTHTLAKAGLARAMGSVEERFLALVGGQQ